MLVNWKEDENWLNEDEQDDKREQEE